MSGIDEWLSEATGSYLLPCDPLDGTTAFFDAVAARRAGDALLVTTTRSVERTPASVRSTVGEVVDATPRAAAGATNVGSPSDLTGISIPVSEFLQGADDAAVAFDSVSPLLFHAEEAAVFRFLTVLTTQVARSDGLGIFPMVPAAHTTETVDAFEQVFDGRVELDGSGDRLRIRVRTAQDGGPDGVPDGWQTL